MESQGFRTTDAVARSTHASRDGGAKVTASPGEEGRAIGLELEGESVSEE